LGSLRPEERLESFRIYAAVNEHVIEVDLYQLQNIALVLDPPVPVVVSDVVGNVLGDHGDGLELLDALLGVETLPIVGWIEKETHFFMFCTVPREAQPRTVLG